MAALLAGCSVPDAVNPVSWYRSLSGASKNDALDKDQSNQQNLEAGGKEPYPNLADVPNAPDQALSAAKRDALRKSLAADRDNARYSDEQLRAGTSTPGIVAPPPPAPAQAAAAQPKSGAAAAAPAPAKAAVTPPPAATAAAPQPQVAAVPKETPLVAPTIAHVPEGEAPAPPPPPPNLTPPAKVASLPPAAADSSLASGKRRAAPASSVAVAAISFADGSTALSDEERNRLSEVAAQQHKEGGAIRVVGHAESAKGGNVAQQELASFTLALNRAKAVAQVLSGEGVASQSIDVEAVPTRPGDASAAGAEVYLEH